MKKTASAPRDFYPADEVDSLMRRLGGNVAIERLAPTIWDAVTRRKITHGVGYLAAALPNRPRGELSAAAPPLKRIERLEDGRAIVEYEGSTDWMRNLTGPEDRQKQQFFDLLSEIVDIDREARAVPDEAFELLVVYRGEAERAAQTAAKMKRRFEERAESAAWYAALCEAAGAEQPARLAAAESQRLADAAAIARRFEELAAAAAIAQPGNVPKSRTGGTSPRAKLLIRLIAGAIHRRFEGGHPDLVTRIVGALIGEPVNRFLVRDEFRALRGKLPKPKKTPRSALRDAGTRRAAVIAASKQYLKATGLADKS